MAEHVFITALVSHPLPHNAEAFPALSVNSCVHARREHTAKFHVENSRTHEAHRARIATENDMRLLIRVAAPAHISNLPKSWRPLAACSGAGGLLVRVN